MKHKIHFNGTFSSVATCTQTYPILSTTEWRYVTCKRCFKQAINNVKSSIRYCKCTTRPSNKVYKDGRRTELETYLKKIERYQKSFLKGKANVK